MGFRYFISFTTDDHMQWQHRAAGSVGKRCVRESVYRMPRPDAFWMTGRYDIDTGETVTVYAYLWETPLGQLWLQFPKWAPVGLLDWNNRIW